MIEILQGQPSCTPTGIFIAACAGFAGFTWQQHSLLCFRKRGLGVHM